MAARRPACPSFRPTSMAPSGVEEILPAVACPNRATLNFGPPLRFSREEGERDALGGISRKNENGQLLRISAICIELTVDHKRPIMGTLFESDSEAIIFRGVIAGRFPIKTYA